MVLPCLPMVPPLSAYGATIVSLWCHPCLAMVPMVPPVPPYGTTIVSLWWYLCLPMVPLLPPYGATRANLELRTIFYSKLN